MDILSLLIGLGGLGLAIISIVLPHTGINVPKPIAWSGISAGILFIVWAIFLAIKGQKVPFGPVLLFIICFAGLVGSVTWCVSLQFPNNNPRNIELSQKCETLMTDISQFKLVREMGESPFFPKDSRMISQSRQENYKDFAERAEYSTKTRQLFNYRFSGRLAQINDELIAQGHHPSIHWMWAADARMDEIIKRLAVYIQRLRAGEIINEPDKP
jgi:hypothetical protein